jgi:glucose/arabinose dehydrogenase
MKKVVAVSSAWQRCLGSVAVIAAVVCALPIHLQAQIKADIIATGLTSPLAFVPDPVSPNISYIVEQGGLVKVLRDGQLQSSVFADLRGLISSGGERGLLGMAFSPNVSSGRVFFNFTNPAGHTVIARFKRMAGSPQQIDPSTRLDLRWPSGERFIRQPFANHNGGNVAFGPDGYLYIGMGDGGDANDPLNNAQNPDALLGKMLRIDVGVADADPAGYRVPSDNPFLDGQPISALGEIWAFGFRNPWRYSFDDFGPGATGGLLVGDVGQGQREEIDYEPPGAGGRNYGWRIREGFIQTPGVPPTPPAYEPLTDPALDIGRTDARSVTGGFVYRGNALGAAYQSRYFFGDFITSRVWSIRLAAVPALGFTNIIDHTSELGGSLGGVASFGRDLNGELYVLTFAGRVLKIVPDTSMVPAPPENVQAVAQGSTVTVTWTPPMSGPPPSSYSVAAGSAPGASDLGFGMTFGTTIMMSAPLGTFYVRVRSIAQGGISGPSEEVSVEVMGAPQVVQPLMQPPMQPR